MNLRTDLAVESHEISGANSEGIIFETESRAGMKIQRLQIDSASAEKRIGKPKGRYITISSLPLTDNFRDSKEQICAVGKELSDMLPERGTVLVIGIGNTDITSDALGPFSAETVLATRHIQGELARSVGLDGLRSTAVLSPGVLGKTGIETGEIVISLIQRIAPSAVIAIDALASKSVSHLGRTIQLSDTGISPGSGIGNNRLRLNKETLGIPVIGIGIPTVVDAYTLVSDIAEHPLPEKFDSKRNLVVTPKEIDLLIERGSKLIGMSINCALQRNYTFEELCSLV